MDVMTPTTLPSPACGEGEPITTLPAVPSGGSLVAAICAISSKMETVTKLGVNDFHKYTYARMPDLMRVLGPLMAQHSITVLQSEVGHELIADGVLRVEFEFTIAHAPSGESRIIRSSGMAKVTGDRGGFNDRAIQAIATTTRKYVLIALFGVVVEDLPDVDHATAPDLRRKTTALKRDQAPVFNRLRGELDAITSVGDLQEWGDTNGVTIATFPADWQQAMRLRYAEKLAELRPASAKPEMPSVPANAKVPARIQRNLDRLNPKPGGIAQQAIEARQHGHRSPGPSQPFLATKDGARRLPPLNVEMRDELPGNLGPPKPNGDGLDIPPMLDRRKANGAEPTFVDLVGGDQ
jgi:hypothetical protein